MGIKALSLPEWIKEVGVAEVAILAEAEAHTVLVWARGKALPRSEHQVKIVRAAKGRLTYQSMIESHVKAKGAV